MWGKPFVTNIESEFKTDRLRNQRVFHDINLRVNDPDEFRVTIIDYLRSLDYNVDVNEMTEFEENDEFAKFFRAGRLKPIKSIIKARKYRNTGSRFPIIWKLLFIIGIISLVGYLMPYEQLNKDLLFYILISSFIASGIFFLIKRVIVSSVWVKIVGVYDVEGTKADTRLVISANTSDFNQRIFDNLREDMAEFYNLISRKYLKQEPSKSLVKPKAKDKSEELVKRLIEVNNKIKKLRNKFIDNKVSEVNYNNMMESLEREKAKYETVMELIS